MLQQESRFVPHVHDFTETMTDGLSMIAYRSVAVSTMTDAAIQELLRASQSRNKAAGLTGVLL